MVITCINQNGERLKFGWFAPIWVKSITGIGADFTVTTSKSNGQDGATYTGATADVRNIVIVLDVRKDDYVDQRNRLYQFFQPRAAGEIRYEDSGISRKAGYYVESVEPSGNGVLKNITVSLLCPDPKWYDLDEQLTELASWEGLIEWDLEITEEPFELTRKVNTLIGNVYNGSNVTQGLKVKFMATGEVVNPSLYNIDRQELMKLNLTMHSGDTVTITTGTGNKRVKLTSGGMTTNINNYMAYPPVWLQAYPGDNLYRYDAESGIDNLNVSIIHMQAYWGV
ncbi:phage tail family protein [Faecalispora jeddahensis]|uniref:phage tail family protein n=1 Tax=Faecalispora jeddahensis TaxID=1414721 RepID=UPI0028A95A5B|nr:phage tail family protein [Faecalispora jeddahensis]